MMVRRALWRLTKTLSVVDAPAMALPIRTCLVAARVCCAAKPTATTATEGESGVTRDHISDLGGQIFSG